MVGASICNEKRENISRFIIDFCALGFIGKMFKTVDLPLLSQFLLMFYKDKPGAKQGFQGGASICPTDF